jgi:hypothetical protein
MIKVVKTDNRMKKKNFRKSYWAKKKSETKAHKNYFRSKLASIRQ